MKFYRPKVIVGKMKKVINKPLTRANYMVYYSMTKEATYTLWHNGNLVDRVPHDPESLDELMEWAYDADGTVEIYSTKGDDDLVWSNYGDEPNEPSDAWHDADALASAGMGTDEDYGYYGE